MSHHYEHGIGVRKLIRFLDSLSKLDIQELDLGAIYHAKLKKMVYRYDGDHE